MCVCVSFTSCSSHHTELLLAKQERRNQSERHRQQPEGEPSMQSICITWQDCLCCLSLCVCSYYTHVCSQVLQQELQSVPVHMLSSGPGSSLKLQPDVLAAEGEAITVLEGTLIDVMWLRLITPQPQSTHSLNETVNSLCSASVWENL